MGRADGVGREVRGRERMCKSMDGWMDGSLNGWTES